MADLAELIGASEREWAEPVETAVFGTADPEALARVIDELCRAEFGSAVAAGLLYAASVGCVFGAALADGCAWRSRRTSPAGPGVPHRRVPRPDPSRRLGFPSARPLAGPVVAGNAVAVVETYLPDPGPQPVTDVAAGLGRGPVAPGGGVRTVDGRGLDEHPMARPGGSGLYPSRTARSSTSRRPRRAAWIDEYARAALAVRDRDVGPPVIAHADWSARNVRVGDDGILAAYDWDSLAMIRESIAVGQATATWRALAEPGETAPTVEEIVAYTRSYEKARGRAFDRVERDAIGAAVVFTLAYTARCEHAIDPHRDVHQRARPRLEADGERLLALAALLGALGRLTHRPAGTPYGSRHGRVRRAPQASHDRAPIGDDRGREFSRLPAGVAEEQEALVVHEAVLEPPDPRIGVGPVDDPRRASRHDAARS